MTNTNLRKQQAFPKTNDQMIVYWSNDRVSWFRLYALAYSSHIRLRKGGRELGLAVRLAVAWSVVESGGVEAHDARNAHAAVI